MVNRFTVILLIFQVIFIILYGLLVDYGEDAQPEVSSAAANFLKDDEAPGTASTSTLDSSASGDTARENNFSEVTSQNGPLNTTEGKTTEGETTDSSETLPTSQFTTQPPIVVAGENSLQAYYPMFQDTHTMMFIGFGFLMTFLKRYGFSSAGYNFLISSFVIQWATLMSGFFRLAESETGKIAVDITTMIRADYACATVLISFGAVLGKTTPLQLIIMAFFETFFYALNEWIGVEFIQAADVGGSIFVHMFGAFFGISVSRVIYKEVVSDHHHLGSSYRSDILSLLGTIFLWMFWPSFNSALATGDQQHRAVLNTYYALAACCVVTFAISIAVDENQEREEFDMIHIQNCTLAGGVAVGAVANMLIGVWGATLVGSLAAIVSVIGYRYLMPNLEGNWKIHDTCGVLNLHGLPAVMGGLFSVFGALAASTSTYGFSLFEVFPAMAPADRFSSDFAMVEAELPGIEAGLGRSAGIQAGYQMLAVVVTIAIAVLSGIVVGFIINIPGILRENFGIEQFYHDSKYWKDSHGEYKDVQMGKRHSIIGQHNFSLTYKHDEEEDYSEDQKNEEKVAEDSKV